MSRTDTTTKLLLSVIALLLAAHLLVLANPLTPRVAWGLADSGAQFDNMINELQGVNKRLDKLQAYLESGNLGVKVKSSDKDTK